MLGDWIVMGWAIPQYAVIPGGPGMVFILKGYSMYDINISQNLEAQLHVIMK